MFLMFHEKHTNSNYSVINVFSNLLLQLVFPVIDGDGVVVSVKSMNQSLKTRET